MFYRIIGARGERDGVSLYTCVSEGPSTVTLHVPQPRYRLFHFIFSKFNIKESVLDLRLLFRNTTQV